MLLERLPQEIHKIQLKITEKEQQINDQNLISNEGKEIHQLYHDLDQMYQDVKEKEEQWLTLEIMQEEEKNP